MTLVNIQYIKLEFGLALLFAATLVIGYGGSTLSYCYSLCEMI